MGFFLQYLGELRRKVRWIALGMDSGRIGFPLKSAIQQPSVRISLQ